MYPILVASFMAKAPRNFPAFVYPEEVIRPGFVHLPLLSYCRNQAMEAIKASGSLTELTQKENAMVRWRASVPDTNFCPDLTASRLELFMDDPENGDRHLRLIFSAPLCGAEFDKLPLVLRLGIELMIRKECRGSDPE
jgi:hypothetical protein